MSLLPISSIDRFFEDEFPSSMTLFPPTPLLRDFDRDTGSVLRRSSPAYEISETKEQFKVSVDLPGVKPEDCQVSVEQNGRLLHIWGGRKVEKDGGYTETRFDQKFSLGDKNIDPSKISANLADGVMVITAAKDPTLRKSHKIAITSNPHPVLNDGNTNEENT